MKMKCFHYPQSFTLIIDVKFNFQFNSDAHLCVFDWKYTFFGNLLQKSKLFVKAEI